MRSHIKFDIRYRCTVEIRYAGGSSRHFGIYAKMYTYLKGNFAIGYRR